MIDIPNITELYEFVLTSLNENQFAQGGFIVGLLAMTGQYLKRVPIYIWSRIKRLLIYQVNIEESDDLFVYFEIWLQKNYTSKYRNVEAALKLDKKNYENYDPITGEFLDSFQEKVNFKQFDDLFYVRRGLNYIRIYKGREKMENARDFKSAFYNKFQISGIFAKRIINKLVKEVHEDALQEKIKSKNKNITVRVSDEHGCWLKEAVLEPKSMDNIIIDGKEDILSDIENFKESRFWYKERDIAYKRGYMLYGDAGTGKTSFILSLAKKLNKDVNFLQLNRTDDRAIRNAFRDLKPNSILVIEDIDAAYSQRKGKDDIKFSFSTLLNCLDGVFSKEDILVFFTTNHIEKLDPALVRSGRIDYKMEFKRPSYEYVNKYLEVFYGDHKAYLNLSDEYGARLPMVDIQDICLRNKNDFRKAVKDILTKDNNLKTKNK